MHAMVYHIPRFMTKHSGIKKFTGQGKTLNNNNSDNNNNNTMTIAITIITIMITNMLLS